MHGCYKSTYTHIRAASTGKSFMWCIEQVCSYHQEEEERWYTHQPSIGESYTFSVVLSCVYDQEEKYPMHLFSSLHISDKTILYFYGFGCTTTTTSISGQTPSSCSIIYAWVFANFFLFPGINSILFCFNVTHSCWSASALKGFP